MDPPGRVRQIHCEPEKAWIILLKIIYSRPFDFHTGLPRRVREIVCERQNVKL